MLVVLVKLFPEARFKRFVWREQGAADGVVDTNYFPACQRLIFWSPKRVLHPCHSSLAEMHIANCISWTHVLPPSGAAKIWRGALSSHSIVHSLTLFTVACSASLIVIRLTNSCVITQKGPLQVWISSGGFHYPSIQPPWLLSIGVNTSFSHII